MQVSQRRAYSICGPGDNNTYDWGKFPCQGIFKDYAINLCDILKREIIMSVNHGPEDLRLSDYRGDF